MRVELHGGRAPLPTGMAGSAVTAFDTPLNGPVLAVQTTWPPRIGLYRRAPAGNGERAAGGRRPRRAADGARPEGAPLVELYGDFAHDLQLVPSLGPFVVRSPAEESVVEVPADGGQPWTLTAAGRGYELGSPRRGCTVVRRTGGPAVLTSTSRRLDEVVSTAADAAGLALVLSGPGLVFAPEGGADPRTALVVDGAEDAAEEALLCLVGLCTVVRPLVPASLRRRLPGPVARLLSVDPGRLAATRPATAEQFWRAMGPRTAPDVERRAMQPPWTDPPWTTGPGEEHT